MEVRLCVKCGIQLSKHNKSGYCNKCRDRNGANNPFYGKHHSDKTIAELKNKCSSASKNMWLNDEYRNRVIKSVSKPRRIGFGEEQSKRVSEWYINNPEQCISRSNTMKKSWATGKIVPQENNVSHSKGEKEIYKYFNMLMPGFVCSMAIKNEYPDYDGINIFPDVICMGNDIIEYYGDYWHANPEKYSATDTVHHGIKACEIWEHDRLRQLALEYMGYRVYVVWQYDYKKYADIILENIIRCIEWDTCNF